MAPNISLRTAFSPNAFGMILSLRRSWANSRSRRFVVRAARRCVIGKQQDLPNGTRMVVVPGEGRVLETSWEDELPTCPDD